VNLVVVRNVAIILAISAVVYFVPGGGNAAAAVSWVVGTAFALALAWVAVMLYRRFRGDLHMLGDSGRALLYGAVGAIVIAGAGANTMLDDPVGAIVWVALVGGAIYALVLVWRRRSLA
jgi:hypothetical protein